MKVNGYEIKPSADLIGANLKDADLKGADLKDADLKDADLDGAYLMYANLEGANLNNANVKKTILEEKEEPQDDKDLKIQQLEEELKKYKEKFNQLKVLLDT